MIRGAIFIREPIQLRSGFSLPGYQPASSGLLPPDMHGPISTGVKGNRVPYGTVANFK